MKAQQLSEQTKLLHQQIKGDLTPNQKWEYNVINKAIMAAKLLQKDCARR